jgi:hypothetical protein
MMYIPRCLAKCQGVLAGSSQRSDGLWIMDYKLRIVDLARSRHGFAIRNAADDGSEWIESV